MPSSTQSDQNILIVAGRESHVCLSYKGKWSWRRRYLDRTREGIQVRERPYHVWLIKAGEKFHTLNYRLVNRPLGDGRCLPTGKLIKRFRPPTHEVFLSSSSF